MPTLPPPHWHFPKLTTQAVSSSTSTQTNKHGQMSACPHSQQTCALTPFRNWFLCDWRRSERRAVSGDRRRSPLFFHFCGMVRCSVQYEKQGATIIAIKKNNAIKRIRLKCLDIWHFNYCIPSSYQLYLTVIRCNQRPKSKCLNFVKICACVKPIITQSTLRFCGNTNNCMRRKKQTKKNKTHWSFSEEFMLVFRMYTQIPAENSEAICP